MDRSTRDFYSSTLPLDPGGPQIEDEEGFEEGELTVTEF